MSQTTFEHPAFSTCRDQILTNPSFLYVANFTYNTVVCYTRDQFDTRAHLVPTITKLLQEMVTILKTHEVRSGIVRTEHGVPRG